MKKEKLPKFNAIQKSSLQASVTTDDRESRIAWVEERNRDERIMNVDHAWTKFKSIYPGPLGSNEVEVWRAWRALLSRPDGYDIGDRFLVYPTEESITTTAQCYAMFAKFQEHTGNPESALRWLKAASNVERNWHFLFPTENVPPFTRAYGEINQHIVLNACNNRAFILRMRRDAGIVVKAPELDGLTRVPRYIDCPWNEPPRNDARWGQYGVNLYEVEDEMPHHPSKDEVWVRTTFGEEAYKELLGLDD